MRHDWSNATRGGNPRRFDLSTEVAEAPKTQSYVARHFIELAAWAVFTAYWFPAFKHFMVAWDNPDGYYSHGYLIPFMCGWTAWLLKDSASKLTPKPSTWAIVMLIVILGLATAFGAINSMTLRGLMFPICVAAFVAALYGWEYVRVFAFPIFYLYFLCPIPDFMLLQISAKVQLWSTTIATLMSKVIGINAIQNGNFIATDNCDIEVGQACSGFRMLVALTAFAVFLVYAVKGESWRKALFVMLAMPLAVIVNSLRVAILVAVGHYWDPEMVHVLHNYSGYVSLLVAFVLMYWIARLLGCREFRLMG